MTKLMQWLLAAGVFMSLWLVVFTGSFPVTLSPAVTEIIIASPIYLLMSFACYSLAVIGYRVATFNDCQAAAEELKQQIKDAKEDLQSKGFKFS